MTALGLRRVRELRARHAVLGLVLLAWASCLLGFAWGYIAAPSESWVGVLQYGVPIALALLALLVRSEESRIPMAAGSACLFVAALLLPSYGVKVALALPALVLAGLLAHRFPTFCLCALFTLSGTYGSVTAFTGVSGDSVADKFMVGLWAAVLGSIVLGRRRVAIRPTPALFLLAGFMLLSLIAMTTTPSFNLGLRAFRLAPMYLSVVLLLGYGGFRARTLDILPRVMVVVCLLVAAYATLRWAIGAAPEEQALQRSSMDLQYNRVGTGTELKVQGSLVNGNTLGLWLACTLPFTVAIALTWHGVYRLLALATLPLGTVALLGSSQRAALAAVVAGTVIVVILHLLARGFRGPRLGVAVAVAVVAVVSASVVFPAMIDDPENRKRYSNILSPGQDGPFQERLHKWRDTLAGLRGEPFGFGLGAGSPHIFGQRFRDISSQAIDNSFLIVAWEQGLVVMCFFIVALLVLLLELLRHAVWTRAPGPAALTAAAAGTLVAIMVEFMAAGYSVAPPVVAGWLIVGLGVAQYGVMTRSASAPLERQRPLAP